MDDKNGSNDHSKGSAFAKRAGRAMVADEPPKANLVKLSGNFHIAAVIETLGEAFALVSKGRNPPRAVPRHPYQHAVTYLLASGRGKASRTSTWPSGRRKPYRCPWLLSKPSNELKNVRGS